MFIDGDSAFVRANKALGENEMDQKCAFYTFFPQKLVQRVVGRFV